MVVLYTLPSCPICNMVKAKLNQKNIPFVEEGFENLPSDINTDRAPVLRVEDKNYPGGFNYILSPVYINDWIKGV